jgi:hypothetical protein
VVGEIYKKRQEIDDKSTRKQNQGFTWKLFKHLPQAQGGSLILKKKKKRTCFIYLFILSKLGLVWQASMSECELSLQNC